LFEALAVPKIEFAFLSGREQMVAVEQEDEAFKLFVVMELGDVEFFKTALVLGVVKADFDEVADDDPAAIGADFWDVGEGLLDRGSLVVFAGLGPVEVGGRVFEFDDGDGFLRVGREESEVAVGAGSVHGGGEFGVEFPVVAAYFRAVAEAGCEEVLEKFFLELDFALLDDGFVVVGSLPVVHALADGEELGHVFLQVEVLGDFTKVFWRKDFAVLHFVSKQDLQDGQDLIGFFFAGFAGKCGANPAKS
jgi:hypothetical protein